MKLPRVCTPRLARIVFAAAAAILSHNSVFAQGDRVTERQELAENSALASDSVRLFAVDADGKTIVSRSLDWTDDWTVLKAGEPVRRVAGLAATSEDGGWLYVADDTQGLVQRISTSNGKSEVFLERGVLRSPGELAYHDGLYVADTGAGKVFFVGSDEKGRPSLVEVAGEIRPGVRISVSAGTLLISDPSSDGITRVVQAAAPDEATIKILQGETSSDESMKRRMYSGSGSGTGEYPYVKKPGAVAGIGGIVYVVSEAEQEIYSTPRLERRAVRGSPPVRRPTSLLATAEHLYALDATRRDVIRLPRPVPTEFFFKGDTPSECMAAFYAYLSQRDSLPTRSVSLVGSLEKTLRREGALQSPYVEGLNEVLCRLNPEICTEKKRPKRILAEGTRIQIPDLFIENTLGVGRVKLTGRRTLAAEAQRQVWSERFIADRDQRICSLNRSSSPRKGECAADLMQRRTGEFLIPMEIVRYVAVVPEYDVRGGELSSELRRLKRICGKRATPTDDPEPAWVNPLERRHAARSTCDCQDPAQSTCCNKTWDEVDALAERFMKVIAYDASLASTVGTTAYVGIAEARIDRSHPDFGTTGGRFPFVDEQQPTSPTPPSSPRCLRPDDDHGTAVAYLIAGQRRRNGGTPAGLAPFVSLVPLTDELNDIESNFRSSPYYFDTRVVNLSLRTERNTPDDGLIKLVDTSQQALFVVAAGNTSSANQGKEVCEQKFVYPACLGKRRNVIVVAATDDDGTQVLPASSTGGKEDGSNWSGRHVHVAAPGVEFYAAGAGGAYVCVRGTSFATPLVTATAAMIVAQGEDDPWRVKNRLIATADPEINLAGKVLGGRLNSKRAVSHLRQTVVVNQLGDEWPIETVPGRLKVVIRNQSRDIPLSDILRLTNVEGAFRLIYLDGDELEIENNVRAGAEAWMLSYYRLTDSGQRSGPQETARLDQFKDYVGRIQ